MGGWTYNGKPILSIDDVGRIVQKPWGFVYLLHLYDKKTGELKHMYIGKKNLYTKRKRKFGKRETAALKDKRSKKYEYVIKESDWKTYMSSNKFIKDNHSKYRVTREIIQVCTNDMDLSFQEAKAILCNDTLDDPIYLNDSVSVRRFGRKVM